MASTSKSPSPSLNEHLSFPSIEPPEQSSPINHQQSRQVLKDRLYIGNLHPTVDEYDIHILYTCNKEPTRLTP